MTYSFKIPTTIFINVALYGGATEEANTMGDWKLTLEDAATQASDCYEGFELTEPFRTFQLDFCHETNSHESTKEVTSEVQEIIDTYIEARQ